MSQCVDESMSQCANEPMGQFENLLFNTIKINHNK
jgi:hypothetical protein